MLGLKKSLELKILFKIINIYEKNVLLGEILKKQILKGY
jgi:hypothetical protein